MTFNMCKFQEDYIQGLHTIFRNSLISVKKNTRCRQLKRGIILTLWWLVLTENLTQTRNNWEERLNWEIIKMSMTYEHACGGLLIFAVGRHPIIVGTIPQAGGAEEDMGKET